MARASRLKVLNRVVDEEAVLIPAHFAGEHMVRVVKTPGGMRPAALRA